MILRLYVIGGRDVGRSFEVEHGAVLGRSPECEARMGDRSISRQHARITRDESGWVIEDLDSRNGLHVRGDRVRRAEISDGAEFLLGEVPIRVRILESAQVSESTTISSGADEPGEIHLEDQVSQDPAPSTMLVVPPVFADPAPAPTSAESEERSTDRERRRAELVRPEASAGLLGGDLAQRPLWVRLVVGVLLLALAGGILFLAFQAVRALRGGT